MKSDRARRVLALYRSAATLGVDEKARLGDLVLARTLRGDFPRFDLPAAAVAPDSTFAFRAWGFALGKVGLALVALGVSGAFACAWQKSADVSSNPPSRERRRWPTARCALTSVCSTTL